MIIHVVVVYLFVYSPLIEFGKEWSLLTFTLSRVSFLSCPNSNTKFC